MNYTLQRECAIVLIYKGIGYHFDALTQFDFSQTFSRATGSRKTLHSKKANPYAFANSKSAATFSFNVLGTKSLSEGVLFELAGLTKVRDSVYKYEDSLEVAPEICDIYVITKQGTYKFDTAALESLEIPLALTDPLAFNASFTASNFTKVQGIDLAAGLIEQNEPLKPTPIQYKLNNIIHNSVINAGISIQQSIEWRQDRSLHNIGQLYVPTKPLLTERTLGINANTYLNTKHPTPEESYYSNLELYKSGILFSMRNALVTHRVGPAEFFTDAHDITVTDKTTNITVEYGGFLL